MSCPTCPPPSHKYEKSQHNTNTEHAVMSRGVIDNVILCHMMGPTELQMCLNQRSESGKILLNLETLKHHDNLF